LLQHFDSIIRFTFFNTHHHLFDVVGYGKISLFPT
jgi:hypothetical protein